MTAPEPLREPDLTDPRDIVHWAMTRAVRAVPSADQEHLNAYGRDYLAYEVKRLAADRDELQSKLATVAEAAEKHERMTILLAEMLDHFSAESFGGIPCREAHCSESTYERWLNTAKEAGVSIAGGEESGE